MLTAKFKNLMNEGPIMVSIETESQEMPPQDKGTHKGHCLSLKQNTGFPDIIQFNEVQKPRAP